MTLDHAGEVTVRCKVYHDMRCSLVVSDSPLSCIDRESMVELRNLSWMGAQTHSAVRAARFSSALSSRANTHTSASSVDSDDEALCSPKRAPAARNPCCEAPRTRATEATSWLNNPFDGSSVVLLEEFKFVPSSLVVAAGATVVFLVSGDGRQRTHKLSCEGEFEAVSVRAGEHFLHEFSCARDLLVTDEVFGFMRCVVQVLPRAQASLTLDNLAMHTDLEKSGRQDFSSLRGSFFPKPLKESSPNLQSLRCSRFVEASADACVSVSDGASCVDENARPLHSRPSLEGVTGEKKRKLKKKLKQRERAKTKARARAESVGSVERRDSAENYDASEYHTIVLGLPTKEDDCVESSEKDASGSCAEALFSSVERIKEMATMMRHSRAQSLMDEGSSGCFAAAFPLMGSFPIASADATVEVSAGGSLSHAHEPSLSLEVSLPPSDPATSASQEVAGEAVPIPEAGIEEHSSLVAPVEFTNASEMCSTSKHASTQESRRKRSRRKKVAEKTPVLIAATLPFCVVNEIEALLYKRKLDLFALLLCVLTEACVQGGRISSTWWLRATIKVTPVRRITAMYCSILIRVYRLLAKWEANPNLFHLKELSAY